MLAITVALLLTTIVCLAFSATRLIGIAGLAVLLFLRPLLLVVLLTIGCVAAYLFHRFRRSKSNELPRLPD